MAHRNIDGNCIFNWPQDSKSYFEALRMMVTELRKIPAARKVLKKYNVHPINIDNFKRVNIDYPKEMTR